MPVTFLTGAEIFLMLPAQQRAKRPKGGLRLRIGGHARAD